MFLIGLILIFVGAISGFMGGLLGIGGGTILVPAIFMTLKHYHIAEDEAMLMAIGTSMMIIIPTSLSASYAHLKKNAVKLSLLKKWTIFVISGAILGTIIATTIPEKYLIGLYIIYMLLIGCLFFYKANFSSHETHTIPILEKLSLPIIFLIGLFSSLFGIGGGSFTVPFMNAIGINLRHAIATSNFVAFFISLPSALNYMWLGKSTPYHPDLLNVGYISFSCLLIILPTCVIMAYFGGKTVHMISERIIRNIFASLLILTAIRIFSITFL